MSLSAKELIDALGLAPHPEGGWYCETWRADAREGQRPSGTAIYYLLEKDRRSHWHRVDAAEIWHFYAGAPLRLELSGDGESVRALTLGADLAAGERPQIVVPAHCWQAAESLGDWTLAGCTVSPGFEFAGFELAPEDWRPGRERETGQRR